MAAEPTAAQHQRIYLTDDVMDAEGTVMSDQLLAEFARTADSAHLAKVWLSRRGIRLRYDGPDRLGLARVNGHRDGTFEFTDDGAPALIFAEGFADIDGWHVVHDLVATPVNERSVNSNGLPPDDKGVHHDR